MRKIISIIIFALLFCISVFAQNNSSQCPLITIKGPTSAALPGETMAFSVLIQGEGKNNLKYKWTVDKGTIVEGEETLVVLVSTEGLDSTTFTATFEIEGLPNACQDKFQSIGVVAPQLKCGWREHYGRIPFEDELARFDPFLFELEQDFEYQGFVWIKTDEKEPFADTKKHIQKLVEYIKFRKVPIDRFIFAIEKSDSHTTTLIPVSKFKELPECENCEIIKGSIFK